MIYPWDLCLDMTSHLFYGQGTAERPLWELGRIRQTCSICSHQLPAQSPADSIEWVGSRARITSPCSPQTSPGTSNSCGTTPGFSSPFLPRRVGKKQGISVQLPARLQGWERWEQPRFHGRYSGAVEHSVGTSYRILQTLCQTGTTHREARRQKLLNIFPFPKDHRGL